MLKISPILLESSASAKKHEENLNNPEFRLTEVITINLSYFLIVFLIFSHLFSSKHIYFKGCNYSVNYVAFRFLSSRNFLKLDCIIIPHAIKYASNLFLFFFFLVVTKYFNICLYLNLCILSPQLVVSVFQLL